MKSASMKKTRMTLRIKPGRFLRIPLRFLKRTNWQSGDRLIFHLEERCVYLFKPPTETDWRIGRLRNRINPGNAGNSPIFAARTYAEFRRMIEPGCGRFFSNRRNIKE